MLTSSQRQALVFIEAFQERTGGVSPSVREIAKGIRHKAPVTVYRLLKGLEERGFIRRIPNRARAIEVIRPVSIKKFYIFDEATGGMKPYRATVLDNAHIPKKQNAETG